MIKAFLRVSVLLLLCTATFVWAQTGGTSGTTAPAGKTGKITGKIVDVATGEALIGATVMLEGTKLGAVTNLDGQYTVFNVPPGFYVLSISAIGYTAKRVTELEVKPGEVAPLDISMATEAVTLGKEVVVTAKRERSSEPAAIKDRGQAKVTKDILTASSIAKTADGNVGAALNRTVGAYQKGGEAIVRGVADRGVVVTMNGSVVPSSDPEKQTAKVDQIATSVVEAIEVVKTFSPELPGNFSGGIVNIKTRSVPTSQTLSAGYSSGYHSETTNKDNFLTQSEGDISVPTNFESDFAQHVYESDIRSTKSRDTLAMLHNLYKSFTNNIDQSREKGKVNQSYALSYGNAFQLGAKARLGLTASISRTQDYNYTGDGIVALWNPTSPGAPLELNRQYGEQRGKYTDLWNGLGSLALEIGDRHTISASYVRSDIEETTTRYLSGPYFYIDYATFRTFSNQFDDRTLNSLQFSGNHRLGGDSSSAAKIDWSATFSRTDFDTPDLRVFQDITQDTTVEEPVYYQTKSQQDYPAQRVFRTVDEDLNSFSVNTTLMLSKKLNFRFGLSGDNRKRSRLERVFRYEPENTLTGTGSSGYRGDLEKWFNGLDQIDYVLVGSDTLFYYRNKIQEIRFYGANYRGTQDIYAIYSMFDARITDRLTAVYGVRLEQTLMFAEGDQRRPDYKSGTLNQLDALPAINLKYELLTDVNLRLSYGSTLARPMIREIAQFTSEEFSSSGRVFNGNPDLQITSVDNYDFRVEWLSGINVLAASVFYKDFTNPIELVFTDEANGNYTYINVPEGTVYGVEFEFRRQLGDFAKVLEPFDFNANLTLIHSETKISEEEKIKRPGLTETTRQMYNQAPYTLNVGVGYSNSKLGTNINVALNRIDDRLSFNPPGLTPDVFLRARTVIDATLKQDIWKGLSLRVSGKNLSDSREIESVEYQGEEYIFTRGGAGRSASVGLNWSL